MQLTQTQLQEKIVHTFFGTLVVLSCVYILILLSLIFSVIERKQSILATKDATSVLSMLEGEYASTVSSITDNELEARSFVRIDTTTFAVRKDPIASYTVLYAR